MKQRQNKGLTLIEILVAVAITVMLTVAVSSIMVDTFEIKNIIENETTAQRTMISLIYIVEKDIRWAYYSPSKAGYFKGEKASAFDGSSMDRLHLVIARNPVFLPADFMERYSDSDIDKTKIVLPQFCEVSYLLKPNPKLPGKLVLY